MAEQRKVLNLRLVETEEGIDFFASLSRPVSFISYWFPFKPNDVLARDEVQELINAVGDAFVQGDGLEHCADFLESPLMDFRFVSNIDDLER